MDLTISPAIPRFVPDLRPSADIAATSRIQRPPLAVAQGPAVAPASPSQEALLARSAIEGRPVTPAGQADASGEGGPELRPSRVLKPWGVPMLPSEEKRRAEAEARRAEVEAARLVSEAEAARAEETEAPAAAQAIEDRPPVPGPTQAAAPTEAAAPPGAPAEPSPPRPAAEIPARPAVPEDHGRSLGRVPTGLPQVSTSA